jgi:hypothetical protein
MVTRLNTCIPRRGKVIPPSLPPLHRSCEAKGYKTTVRVWSKKIRKESQRTAAKGSPCHYTHSELPVEETEAALLQSVELLQGRGVDKLHMPFLSFIMLREPLEWFLSAANWVRAYLSHVSVQ